MNQLVRWLAIPIGLAALGAGGSAMALGYTTVGATPLEHPEGLSIRQESNARRGGFFVWYGSTRGHVGGGLRGGK